MHKNPRLLASGYTKWMLTTIPANLAYAPLSTFIPLLLLSVGGTVLSIAIAVSAFNAVAIASSFMWGRLADLTGKRKPFILISYLGITLMLVGIYFSTSSIAMIMAFYAGIALFQQANPTAYNLLIMETDKEANWGRNFSNLQMVSNLGMVLGLVVAAIVTGLATLKLLILVFALASFASAIVANLLIIEPMVNMTKEESILKHASSLVVSMFSYPFRFSTASGVDHGLVRASRLSLRKYINNTFLLLCVSSFIYSIGANMFNTEYPASLQIHGLAESEVFLVILVASVIQTIFFHYAIQPEDKGNVYKSYTGMSYMRSLSYAFIAISFITTGIGFLTANIILYAIVSGITYPLYYTASYALVFDSLRNRKRGNALGIYNGVGTIGNFFGAVAASVSQVFGFPVLFLASAALVFTSVFPIKACISNEKRAAVPIQAVQPQPAVAITAGK
ncbi:MAG: MFS transporter [Candidatus Micrarchaeaceae archaeon]